MNELKLLLRQRKLHVTGSKGKYKSRKDAEKFKVSYFQNVYTELKFLG